MILVTGCPAIYHIGRLGLRLVAWVGLLGAGCLLVPLTRHWPMQNTNATKKGLIEILKTDAGMRLMVFGSMGLVLIGAFSALTILRPTRSVYELNIFYHQFVVHDLPGCLLSAAIILVALVLCRRLEVPLRVLSALDRTRYSVGAVLVVLLAVGTLTVYHNYPLCVDEFTQLFQAGIFAKGRIWTRYPPQLLDSLLSDTSIFFSAGRVSGRVITAYWPGYSFLQTPLVVMGLPWLLNPLLAAATLLLIRRLAHELHPDSNAPAWAMLFTLASPVFVISGISYYEMAAQLLLNLVFTLLMLRRTGVSLLLAGLVGSLALLQKNPLPHLFYAIPWWIWLLGSSRGCRMSGWLVTGYAPVSVLVGIGWAVLRAQLSTEGFAPGTVWEHPWEFLSFLSVSSLLEVLLVRTISLVKLAVWAVPGLPVLAFLGARVGWQDRRIRTLAASGLLMFFGYFLFTANQGHGWGYRYFHGAWATLPLLACGIVATRREVTGPTAAPVPRLAATLALSSLVILNMLRLYQVDAWMDSHLAQLPRLEHNRSQLCFIRPWEGYYSIDLVQNDPFLRGDTIFLRSQGPDTERAFVERHFPDAVHRSGTPDDPVWTMSPLDMLRLRTMAGPGVRDRGGP